MLLLYDFIDLFVDVLQRLCAAMVDFCHPFECLAACRRARLISGLQLNVLFVAACIE